MRAELEKNQNPGTTVPSYDHAFDLTSSRQLPLLTPFAISALRDSTLVLTKDSEWIWTKSAGSEAFTCICQPHRKDDRFSGLCLLGNNILYEKSDTERGDDRDCNTGPGSGSTPSSTMTALRYVDGDGSHITLGDFRGHYTLKSLGPQLAKFTPYNSEQQTLFIFQVDGILVAVDPQSKIPDIQTVEEKIISKLDNPVIIATARAEGHSGQVETVVLIPQLLNSHILAKAPRQFDPLIVAGTTEATGILSVAQNLSRWRNDDPAARSVHLFDFKLRRWEAVDTAAARGETFNKTTTVNDFNGVWWIKTEVEEGKPHFYYVGEPVAAKPPETGTKRSLVRVDIPAISLDAFQAASKA